MKTTGTDRGLRGTEAKITLSLACNNACVFCYNRVSKEHVAPLDEARVIQLIDEAAEAGCDSLNFIGGEVTILPWFPAVLAHGGQRFATVSVNTNGRRFHDADFARSCVDAGLTYIDISLHASTPELHDAASQAVGAWKQTVAGLRNLVALDDRGARVSVSTLVLDTNVANLVELGSLLREIGVRSWRVKYSYGALGDGVEGLANDYVPPYAEAVPEIIRLFEEHGRELSILLADVPMCLLGDYVAYSADFDRHRVAQYGKSDDTSSVRVSDRWADATGRCTPCAAAAQCCKVSPAYAVQHGVEELAPFDAEALSVALESAQAFQKKMDAGAQWSRCRSREEAPRSPIDALFATVDAAARRGDWMTVRRTAVEILREAPEHPEAVRMRRRAEARLLDRKAEHYLQTGEAGRARRVRRVLARYYSDLL